MLVAHFQTPLSDIHNPLPAPILKVDNIGFFDYIPDWQFFWHFHTDVTEVIIISEGSGYLHVGNKCIPVFAGYVCILSPHVLHYFSSDSNNTLCYYSVQFYTQNPSGELENWLNNACCLVLPLSEDLDYLQSHFRILTNHLKSNSYTADQTVQALLFSFICWTHDRAEELHIHPLNQGKMILQDVLTYISIHYMEKINLADLSFRFGISPAHLNRLFKNACGLSPINYIIYYRITQAIILLDDLALNISDIAYAVGYQNSTHFSNLFARHIGCTPSEFRRRYLNYDGKRTEAVSFSESGSEKEHVR